MNFKFRHTDKIVGVFVILSIFLLAGAMFLIIFNKKLLVRKYTFYTQFTDAKGLINQDVIFKGFKIGKIKKLKLNKANGVDVEFFIYSDYIDKIIENSLMNRVTSPLGASTIYFIPNMYNNRIAEEFSFIPSLNSEYGAMLLTMGEVEKEADAISNIVNNVNKLLESLNKDHNPQDSSIARILVNTADVIEGVKGELKHLDNILLNVTELSNNIKDPDGLVQRLVDPNGEVIFNPLQKSMENLVDVMKNLSEFSDFINKQSTTIETLLLDSKTTMKAALDVIEGIKNNPLIKGGITEKKEQNVVKESIRDMDF